MHDREVEVRLSDLLAILLKSFKMILCIMLLLGVIGATFGAYSTIKAQHNLSSTDIEAAEKTASSAERLLFRAQSDLSFQNDVAIPGAEQAIEHAERTILQMQEYMKNSLYMGMNPFNCGTARLRFSIEADYPASQSTADLAKDSRAEIVAAYTHMCPFDSDVLEQVRSIIGVDVSLQYIEELITVTSDDFHCFVEISACYDDLQAAEAAVNCLYQAMRARADGTLPQHQTKVLSTYSGYEVNWNMSRKQAASEKRFVNAENALLEANELFQALQNDTEKEQAVTDAYAAFNNAQVALQRAYSSRPSLKSVIKYGIFGGIIGLVLGSCLALGKGLFGGVIQNQNEVISRYPFPLIGVLPRSKRIWFSKAIQKLESDPTGSFDAVTQATVQSLLFRIGEKHVCLVSTGDGTVAKKLAVYTDNSLHVIGNIIDSADAVKKLAQYEGIVLVEERGKSRLDLVDAEVLRAKTLNKEIIGIVLA